MTMQCRHLLYLLTILFVNSVPANCNQLAKSDYQTRNLGLLTAQESPLDRISPNKALSNSNNNNNNDIVESNYELDRQNSRFLAIVDKPPASVNADETGNLAFAEAVIDSKQLPAGIGIEDYQKINSLLLGSKELMATAKNLAKSSESEAESAELLQQAMSFFHRAQDVVRRQRRMTVVSPYLRNGIISQKRAATATDDSAGHAAEDEERAKDISRSMYETFITFPECLERLFEDCLAIVNRDLRELGLSEIDIIVHEKRNINQEGYNRVVIVTNELVTRVKGRSGNGIVHYPFQWDDALMGLTTLGVDGKWNCLDLTPEECCDIIKKSAPNPDTKGNYIECHIFVPFGGKGNARRDDRVFINLSPDGRVHEAPIIQ